MLNIKFDFLNKLKKLRSQDINYIRKTNNFYDNAPFPTLVKSKGRVLYVNNAFTRKFRLSLSDSFLDFFKSLDIKSSTQIIKLNNEFFNLYINKLDEEVEIYYFTELFYNMENDKIVFEKMAIAYIYIDNYDEIIEEIEESKKAFILGMIDRKLNEFTKKIHGVITKFDRDRYILFFNQEQLVYLREDKFKILDEIRTINPSSKIPFTLSMGVGFGKGNLPHMAESARSATDLALGRGGDQAVLKNGETYWFFGGHGKEYNTGSRVKARVKAHILNELINEAENVVIMGHSYPDLDSLSSGIGIYKIVKSISSSIPCNIVLNDVTSAISSLYNRITKENEYKSSVFIDSKRALDITNKNTLVVVVDSYKRSILECPDLLDLTDSIVIFDHHRKAEDYIRNEVLVYHDVQASSTAELVTEMIMYMKHEVKLLSVEVDALLSGITVDTKGFVFKTSAKTFEAASFLKKRGADSSNVHVLLQSDLEIFKSVVGAVQNAEIYQSHFAIAVVEDYKDNPKLVVAKASDELLNIENIKMSFAVCVVEDSIIVSSRSLGEYNVQLIMEKYGGGGHKTVAAAQVKDMTLDELISSIKTIIDNICEEEE